MTEATSGDVGDGESRKSAPLSGARHTMNEVLASTMHVVWCSNQANSSRMHVVWGHQPNTDPSDDSLDSRHGVGSKGRLRSRAMPSMDSSGATDSNDVPFAVQFPDESHQSSSSDTSGRPVNPMDGSHVVFQDNHSSSSDNLYVPGTPESQISGCAGGSVTTSVGSQLHGSGRCRPCMFVHSSLGCAKGAYCEYCHLTHSRRTAQRPSKVKRDRFKAMVERQLGSEASVAGPAGALGDDGLEQARGDEWESFALDANASTGRRGTKGRTVLAL